MKSFDIYFLAVLGVLIGFFIPADRQPLAEATVAEATIAAEIPSSEFDVPANLIAARHLQIAIAEAQDHISVVFEDESDVTCGKRGSWYQCVARLRMLGGTVRLHCSATGDGCYAMEPECSQ